MIQQWTWEHMEQAFELFKTGIYSWRKIAKLNGIHVSTLNKRFRGIVKGTQHQLGSKRTPKVIKTGTKVSSEIRTKTLWCLDFICLGSVHQCRYTSFLFSRGRDGACSIGRTSRCHSFPFSKTKLKLACELAEANKRRQHHKC